MAGRVYSETRVTTTDIQNQKPSGFFLARCVLPVVWLLIERLEEEKVRLHHQSKGAHASPPPLAPSVQA